MAKLYFHYSTMNAGKSTLLLQASYNYIERGMQTYLLTANFDDRAGKGRIASRIGIAAEADTYTQSDDLFAKIEARLAEGPCACVLVDEAQWMTRDQVWQLARVVDDLRVPVMCYGLRVDFRGSSSPAPPPFWRSPTRCARCARSAIAGRRRRWSSASTPRARR
jgi:thymidine kinase